MYFNKLGTKFCFKVKAEDKQITKALKKKKKILATSFCNLLLLHLGEESTIDTIYSLSYQNLLQRWEHIRVWQYFWKKNKPQMLWRPEDHQSICSHPWRPQWIPSTRSSHRDHLAHMKIIVCWAQLVFPIS